jgi:hypothetical protein
MSGEDTDLRADSPARIRPAQRKQAVAFYEGKAVDILGN